MTTVKQLIEWLKTQDQDAIVEVVYHGTDSRGFYNHDVVTQKPFTPELSEYTDFRDNQFVKPDSPVYGKSVLLLGSIDN